MTSSGAEHQVSGTKETGNLYPTPLIRASHNKGTGKEGHCEHYVMTKDPWGGKLTEAH